MTEKSTTRRSFLRATSATALAAGLSGCGLSSRTPAISFYQDKREVIPYFENLLQDFNTQHRGQIQAIHDTTSNLSAGFTRGSPPDLGCLNYNYGVVRFQERGAFSDLSDLQDEAAIDPSVQDLVNQYPTYPGRTSVVPYSVMAAGVLYNKEIFAEHALDVPSSFSEFMEICDTLEDAGVTPIYSTFGDPWTIARGLVDYSIGGSMDVAEFFNQLYDLGPDAGPDAEVSFSRNMREPLEKMLKIAAYSQPGATSRFYGDGNVAFARGEAAMYFQGPWALIEIDTVNPDASIGIFPLPMTEDPDELQVRVNLDLALWVPEASPYQDEARELLRFLIDPAVADPYNEEALGFGVREDAPDISDSRLRDLQPYMDRAAFYQGVSVSLPPTIPFENYAQAIVTGQSLEGTLRTLDEDWARLARR